MKAKLTLTIEEELIPQAKEAARAQGLSLSQLVENALRDVSSRQKPTFSQKWRGKFVWAERDDERYRALVERYR